MTSALTDPMTLDGAPAPVVYQLNTGKRWLQDMDNREPLIRFLHAHGLRGRFVMGTTLKIRERSDGTLWLHTRRATREAPDFEYCTDCETCVKTTNWIMRVAAPVPYVGGGDRWGDSGVYVKDGYYERLRLIT